MHFNWKPVQFSINFKESPEEQALNYDSSQSEE